MAKPILVIKFPELMTMAAFDEMNDFLLKHPIQKEYWILIVQSSSLKEAKFEVFYEKDFNEVKYEELKAIIKEACNTKGVLTYTNKVSIEELEEALSNNLKGSGNAKPIKVECVECNDKIKPSETILSFDNYILSLKHGEYCYKGNVVRKCGISEDSAILNMDLKLKLGVLKKVYKIWCPNCASEDWEAYDTEKEAQEIELCDECGKEYPTITPLLIYYKKA